MTNSELSNSLLKTTVIDVVVPMYNEEHGVAQFHQELCSVLSQLPYRTSIIYVDDGSSDNTASELSKLADNKTLVRVVQLSRNFGHQAALSAGLDIAEGDVIVMMDGDGQHPPALIPEMIRLYQQGYEIVQTQRVDTFRGTGVFKKLTARLFYEIINRVGDLHLVPGSADFRLISQSALKALRALPEYHRFLRGMVSWIGFRSILLPYEPRARLAGSSKYSLSKMINFARDGVFSFSLFPLRLGIFLGVGYLLLALAEIVYVLTLSLTNRASTLVPGWSSLIIIVTSATGVIMMLLGIIGVYVGMIFQEVKRRPVYIVRADSGASGQQC